MWLRDETFLNFYYWFYWQVARRSRANTCRFECKCPKGFFFLSFFLTNTLVTDGKHASAVIHLNCSSEFGDSPFKLPSTLIPLFGLLFFFSTQWQHYFTACRPQEITNVMTVMKPNLTWIIRVSPLSGLHCPWRFELILFLGSLHGFA